MKTVVLATNNAHKVAEIATALDFPGWEFRTLRELGIESDPAEDADTFEGNARIKARAAHEASGGLAALADDSGLVVDALDGAPGVHSARYAGELCDDAIIPPEIAMCEHDSGPLKSPPVTTFFARARALSAAGSCVRAPPVGSNRELR